MKVFKFGGASVKDAEAVRNVCRIIGSHGINNLIVVISAMGKTTNALEELLELSQNHKPYQAATNALYDFHQDITRQLFPDIHHEVHFSLAQRFQSLTRALSKAKNLPKAQAYDGVVAHGELISTTIVQAYLKEQGTPCRWIDARDYISTNNLHKEPDINWALTSSRINRELPDFLEKEVLITQGFIGRSAAGNTVTLGREGSDFTAAIFASSLNAESVTIWKDVPGVLSGDPKLVKNASLYPELSYYDAAEMTYYGATVIHPKTIKPLANQNIPLFVRSFFNPEAPGTRIGPMNQEVWMEERQKLEPAIIYKQKQTLLTFHIRDFSFVTERHLSNLFFLLDLLHVKINLMQNSAISFSICIDGSPVKTQAILDNLETEYEISYNTGLTLITAKNYSQELIDELMESREILLEQRTRHTYQIVVRSND